MLQLIDAVGVGYDGIIFIWRDFALCNIKHALPPINNLPLFPHTGDIGIAGVYHFASLFIVLGFADTGLGNSVGITLVG